MERLFEISELNLPLGAGREKYKRCALSAFASVAQLVEQQTLNLFVTGSTPVRGTSPSRTYDFSPPRQSPQ